jgi:hydroxymethylglutaryl-CoA reductase (NADPH)
MASTESSIARLIQRILYRRSVNDVTAELSPSCGPLPPPVTNYRTLSKEKIQERWNLLPHAAPVQVELLDPSSLDRYEVYSRNIENYIGTVKVPLGLAGPLRVRGLFAQGDYYIPLATTEAALVASYNRGVQLISAAGGCTAVLLSEGVSRSPGFAFHSLSEVATFVHWIVNNVEILKETAQATTRHGKLTEVKVSIEGNHVYLNLEYTTGDASGQNMVTIATDAVSTYIVANSPVKPSYHFVEANMSGDKKASSQSFLGVRGKKVTAEVRLSSELIQKRIHTTAARMVDYWRMSALGGVLSGTMGVQGHYANGLAAIYIACGQDAACVAESAVGVTRFEVTEDQGLYAAVTLPNLMVGTIGGGTGLPSQSACLQITGLHGAGNACAFAEICAGLLLGGELSIIGALSAGHFTRAHKHLARGKDPKATS